MVFVIVLYGIKNIHRAKIGVDNCQRNKYKINFFMFYLFIKKGLLIHLKRFLI